MNLKIDPKQEIEEAASAAIDRVRDDATRVAAEAERKITEIRESARAVSVASSSLSDLIAKSTIAEVTTLDLGGDEQWAVRVHGVRLQSNQGDIELARLNHDLRGEYRAFVFIVPVEQ